MLAVVPVTAKLRGRGVPDGITATSRARARWAAPACPVPDSQLLLAWRGTSGCPGPGRYRPRSAHRPPPLALAFMTSDTRSVTTAEDGSRFASTTSYIPFSGPELKLPAFLPV